MPTMKDLIDRTRELSANAFDKVAGGLRGQVNSAGGAPAAPTPTTNAVVPYDPVEGQRFGPANEPPRMTAANPNVGPGRPSPEAAAYRAAQGATPPSPAPVEPPGMMSRIKSGAVMLGRGIGGIQAGFGVKNLAEKDYGNAADNIFQGAATAVNPAIGFAGNVLTGLRDAGMNAMYKARTGEDYDPNFGKKPQGLRVAPQAAAAPMATTPTAAPVAEGDNMIDTTRGQKLTPAQVMQGNAVPVEGQGAFQRTGDKAFKVGARSDNVAPGASPDGGLRGPSLKLPQASTLAGHMVNLAALNAQAQSESAREHSALSQANLGIRYAQAGMQIKKQKQELAAGANTALDKTVNDHISGMLADPEDRYKLGGAKGMTEMDSTYKDRIGQHAAQTKNRINYTLANRKDGKNLEDLSDTEQQQLLLLDRLQRKVTAGRSDTVQQLRDVFGNKRFDSNDLYSYAPVAKEMSLIPGGGGYHITTANGNTVTAKRGVGGVWNYMSPNGPIDSDIAELLTKQLKAKESKGK